MDNDIYEKGSKAQVFWIGSIVLLIVLGVVFAVGA